MENKKDRLEATGIIVVATTIILFGGLQTIAVLTLSFLLLLFVWLVTFNVNINIPGYKKEEEDESGDEEWDDEDEYEEEDEDDLELLNEDDFLVDEIVRLADLLRSHGVPDSEIFPESIKIPKDKINALLIEGLNSGEATPMNQEDWDALRAKINEFRNTGK